jgi:hypothetical protein
VLFRDLYGREHPVTAIQRAYTSLGDTFREPYFTPFLAKYFKKFYDILQENAHCNLLIRNSEGILTHVM